MGRRTGQNSQLHLCVLNFIYASSTSFMLAQLHLCLLNFIYASSTSFMRPQLHLCLLNFIYASSTFFAMLNFIYASSTFFTMLNFFHHAQLFHFLHSCFYHHYNPLRDCVILIPTGMGIKVYSRGNTIVGYKIFGFRRYATCANKCHRRAYNVTKANLQDAVLVNFWPMQLARK